MNCSVCGTMIPNGQSNCPNCGAMVQPMGGYQQPNMGQPMGEYQQPVQPMGGYQQPDMGQSMGGVNFGGYVNSLRVDIMKIVSLVGAFFIMLAPFFNWFKYKMSVYIYTEKDHANMFGLAGNKYDKGSFAFFGIMMLFIGIFLILWEIADFVPAMANIKSKVSVIPYIDLIVIAVALLFIIIALADGDINDLIKYAKEVGKAGHGAGPVIGFIGVIASATPRVLKIANINI